MELLSTDSYKTFKMSFFRMVIGSSTVVKDSATHPEIMGLNPATVECGERNKEKWYIG